MAEFKGYKSDLSGELIPDVANRVEVQVILRGGGWNNDARFDIDETEVGEYLTSALPDGVEMQERKLRGRAAQKAKAESSKKK